MTSVWTMLVLRFLDFNRVCPALEGFKKAPSRPSLTRSTVDLVTPLRWFNLQGPAKLGGRSSSLFCRSSVNSLFFVFRYYLKLAEMLFSKRDSGLVLVLVPLVPLLEEALVGAIKLGLPAAHIRDAPDIADDLCAWMRGRLVFCSFEAAASSAYRLLAAAVDIFRLPVVTVVDEAHMVTLDMSYRYLFGTVWTLGYCFARVINVLILTATLRPVLEAEVMIDLGLEECVSFSVIRSPSDRGFPVRIQCSSLHLSFFLPHSLQFINSYAFTGGTTPKTTLSRGSATRNPTLLLSCTGELRN